MNNFEKTLEILSEENDTVKAYEKSICPTCGWELKRKGKKQGLNIKMCTNSECKTYNKQYPISEDIEQLPYGMFHGNARGYSYRFYGDDNQQITVSRKHNMPIELPEKMTAEELLKLKGQDGIIWNYYPKGKLF